MMQPFADDTREKMRQFVYFNCCVYEAACANVDAERYGFAQACIAVVNQYKDVVQNYYNRPLEAYGAPVYIASSKRLLNNFLLICFC